jgi:hypothetical protein
MGRSLGAFHANGILDVLAGVRITNSGLTASWRRSGHLHALDPANRAQTTSSSPPGACMYAEPRLSRRSLAT